MAGTATQSRVGTAHLRLMSAPPAGQGGNAQFQVQYPPGTPVQEQYLAPNSIINAQVNTNWNGTLEKGTILEIGAFDG